MLEKTCSMCGKTKPIECFTIDNRKEHTKGNFRRKHKYKDGYYEHCKECNREKARKFRAEHKLKTGNADYRGSGKIVNIPKEDRLLMSAIRTRIAQSKQNNKRTGRPFNLTDDYMYKLYKSQSGLCALTNYPMVIDGDSNLKLSIDKIMPELGYVEGNVQWTLFCANRAKGDLLQEDFIKLCKMVIERATTIENTEKSGSE